MTIKANATQGNSVRRVSWPPRLFLIVDEEDYMNAALDPAVSRFTVRQNENEAEAENWRGKGQAFLRHCHVKCSNLDLVISV